MLASQIRDYFEDIMDSGKIPCLQLAHGERERMSLPYLVRTILAS